MEPTDSTKSAVKKPPGEVDAAHQANQAATSLSHEANPAPGAAAAAPPKEVDSKDHTAHAGDENAGSVPAATPVPVPPEMAAGVDVSQFQGAIDWDAVHKSGVSFAYVRASDGTTIHDKNFVSNMHDAQQAGLVVGPYHYFTTTSPVKSQIRNFVSQIHKGEAGDLPPVIDVEDPHQFRHYSVKRRVQMIQQMLDGVEKELGQKPMLYMSTNFSSGELHNAPQFDKYKLWVADYNGGQPVVPQPWTEWNYWQHSKTGTVPGIKGKVDLDFFNGPASQLGKVSV